MPSARPAGTAPTPTSATAAADRSLTSNPRWASGIPLHPEAHHANRQAIRYGLANTGTDGTTCDGRVVRPWRGQFGAEATGSGSTVCPYWVSAGASSALTSAHSPPHSASPITPHPTRNSWDSPASLSGSAGGFHPRNLETAAGAPPPPSVSSPKRATPSSETPDGASVPSPASPIPAGPTWRNSSPISSPPSTPAFPFSPTPVSITSTWAPSTAMTTAASCGSSATTSPSMA